MSAKAPGPEPTPKIRRHATALGVVLVSAAATGALLAGFASAPRLLWDSLAHDRNRHYVEAQRLALDLGALDVLTLLRDLEALRTYPPLHAVLAAAGLWVFDMDSRAAVVPSLVGFWMTAVFAFLVVRRCVDSQGGPAAGFAALLVLASPAHRHFATDVMLESLGAGLSAACLYLYVRTAQSRAPRPARWLGLALSALLLLKYNYWLLVVLALALAAVIENRRASRRALADAVQKTRLRAAISSELRQPLNYVAGLAVATACGIAFTGGGRLEIPGIEVSLTKPYNSLHVAHGAVFLRAVLWWGRGGRQRLARLDPRLRALVGWHVLPAAVFLLLPKRLGYLLHLVVPKSVDPALGEALRVYESGVLQGYHANGFAALLAAALALLGLWRWQSQRRGTLAIACFALLSTVLTLLHPNHQLRFVHTWIAAYWMLAGVGLAAAAALMPSPAVRRAFVLGASAAAMIWAAPSFRTLLDPVRAAAPGPSTLDVADRYLPHLRHASRVAFVANLPVGYFAEWTFAQRFRERDRFSVFDGDLLDAPAGLRASMQRWIASTGADALVIMRVSPESPFFFHASERYGELLDAAAFLARANGWRGLLLQQHGVQVEVVSPYGSERSARVLPP